MTENESGTHRPAFDHLREVRASALEHTRLAYQFGIERRELMRVLIDQGVSQAEIARELGVTRQAVQKMLAIGLPTSTAGPA
jgi:DNA-binding XRE family transcriptional regulator